MRCSLARGYAVDGSQNIYAWNFWACDDGNDIPLQVSIARYVSPAAGFEFANTCS